MTGTKTNAVSKLLKLLWNFLRVLIEIFTEIFWIFDNNLYFPRFYKDKKITLFSVKIKVILFLVITKKINSYSQGKIHESSIKEMYKTISIFKRQKKRFLEIKDQLPFLSLYKKEKEKSKSFSLTIQRNEIGTGGKKSLPL